MLGVILALFLNSNLQSCLYIYVNCIIHRVEKHYYEDYQQLQISKVFYIHHLSRSNIKKTFLLALLFFILSHIIRTHTIVANIYNMRVHQLI